MPEIEESVSDGEEVVVNSGVCQICGQVGPTIVRALAPPPNQTCPKCAIEYGPSLGGYDDQE